MIKAFLSKHRFEITFITIVAILGFFLRLWWINTFPLEPFSDFFYYQTVATNIFNGKGIVYQDHPTAFQGMGYPIILGLLYKLFDSYNILIAKYFNVVLSVATLIISYFILNKLTKNKKIVNISFVLISVFPVYISYCNVLGTEVIFTFFFSIIILLQLIKSERHLLKYSILGILIGIACLIKPLMLLYPIVVALTYFLQTKNIKKSSIMLATSATMMVLLILPWTIQNYKVFKMFIPISYNEGYVLFVNNNDDNFNGSISLDRLNFTSEFNEKLKKVGFIQGTPIDQQINQLYIKPELNDLFKKEGQQWILSHPKSFVKLGLIRLRNTFFPNLSELNYFTRNIQTNNDLGNIRQLELSNAFFTTLIHFFSAFSLLFVFISLVTIIKSNFLKNRILLSNINLIPTINILYFSAIYFVTEGQPRYNFPLLFLMIPITVYGIIKIMEHVSLDNSYKLTENS